jgi:hypothetical protein
VNMSAGLSMISERTQQKLLSHAKVGGLPKVNSYHLIFKVKVYHFNIV